MLILNETNKKTLYNIHINNKTFTYFGILITLEELPWGCIMSNMHALGKFWFNFTISYINVDIVWHVNGILSVDNKG